MEELRKKKGEILKKLEAINEKITDEVLENATQEELEEYLELVDDIVPKLAKIEKILRGNNK